MSYDELFETILRFAKEQGASGLQAQSIATKATNRLFEEIEQNKKLRGGS